MPVDEARRFLGEGFLIGGTANTIEDVRRIHRASADYIGCGPFRYTETKKNLSPILGLAGYEEIMKTMRDEAITIPLCAIGGITLADVANIMSVGVDGIAVSGAVLNAADPVEEMKKFIHANDRLHGDICKATDTFQMSLHLICLKYKLLVIGKCLKLASATLTGKFALGSTLYGDGFSTSIRRP